MKLGVGYNLWDCEELLWRSVESVRAHAHFIVVRRFSIVCGGR